MALKANDRLPIGELARRTGIAVSAIRYYEEQGLIAPDRNAGGQRRFLRSDMRRLSFILIAQQFGFTLPQIREVLDKLPNGRTPNKADWTKIGETFRAELDAKIETLTELRNRLDKCVGCGCLSLSDCTLYNPQDRAAKKGTGPRFLMGDKPEEP
jgi:MerR family redox-sensitive transcriptional activator SoxR